MRSIMFVLVLMTFSSCLGEEQNDSIPTGTNKVTFVNIQEKQVIISSLFGRETMSNPVFNANAYRIPNIVSSVDQKVLLASADVRYDQAGDVAKIEVGICRSLDDGVTWQDYRSLFKRDNKANKYNRVYDCSLCVDRNPKSKFYGRIWAFAKIVYTDKGESEWDTRGQIKFLVTYSDDIGLTWAMPTDLSSLFPSDAYNLSTGVAPGITLKNGMLVQPVYFTRKENSVRVQRAMFIYSKNGKTWEAGPVTPKQAGENSIIETSNNNLFMTARSFYANDGKRRIYTFNFTDYTWVNRPELEVISTVDCQESVVSYGGVYLYSQPTGYLDGSGRTKITIFKSKDLKVWTKLIQITGDAYCYGYSTILLTHDRFGIIYEGEAPLHEIKYANLNTFLPLIFSDNN